MAAFLAFVMIFGYFAVFEMPLRAATQLSSGMDMDLDLGNFINPSPTLVPRSLDEGMIHLSFPVEYLTTGGDVFELVFPIGGALRILRVTLFEDNIAQVEYIGGSNLWHVNRGTTGNITAPEFGPVHMRGSYVVANAPVYPGTHPDVVTPPATVGVYEGQIIVQPSVVAPVPGILPPGNWWQPFRYYLDPGVYNNPGNPFVWIGAVSSAEHLYPNPPSPTVPTMHYTVPTFGIQRGYGFSFRDHDATTMNQVNSVSFLWEDDGTFHVVLGGMEDGHIYDFVLHHFPLGSTTPPPVIGHQTAFLGFRYTSQPVARHRTQAGNYRIGPVVDNNPATGLFGRYATTPPAMPPLPTVPGRPGFPDGWTNWDLGVGVGALLNIANVLEHTQVVGDAGNDWYPGGINRHGAPGDDNVDNMLQFNIEMPLRWRHTTATNPTLVPSPTPPPVVSNFVPISIHERSMDNFEMSYFNFGITGASALAYHFTLRDMFGADPIKGPVPGQGPTNGQLHIIPAVPVPGWTTGDPIPGVNVFLDMNEDDPFGLPPSQMFHMSTLQLGNPPPAWMHNAPRGYMNLRGLHTFLEYDVVFKDGAFHVRIVPFPGIGGRYSLNFGGTLPVPPQADGGIGMAFVITDEDTPDTLYIPLDISPGLIIEFNVVFRPDLPEVPDIHSQWMRFRATADRMMITAPGNFTVTPNHPNLRYILEEEGLAEFEVDFAWSQGLIGTLADYFDLEFGGNTASVGDPPQYGEGQLMFTYHIRSRLNPESDVVTSIAEVEVTARRHVNGDIEWWISDVQQNSDFLENIPMASGTHSLRGASEAVAIGRNITIRENFSALGMTSSGHAIYLYEQDPTTGLWTEVTPITGLVDFDPNADGSHTLTVSDDPLLVATPHRVRIVSTNSAGNEASVIINIENNTTTTAATTAGNRIPRPIYVAGVEPHLQPRNQPWNITLPMHFVIRDDSPPLQFEGIYFLTNTLTHIETRHFHEYLDPPANTIPNPRYPGEKRDLGYEHESTHTDRSFLSLSRPDSRPFPPPYNLQVWTDGIDPETREAGFFDMSFMVPWEDIEAYLARSPYREAGYEHEIIYRIFIGTREQITNISTVEPHQRTLATTPIVGLIMGLSVSLPFYIFPIVHEDRPSTSPLSPSSPGDFNFGTVAGGQTIATFNVHPNFVNRGGIDPAPANLTALNAAFREHLVQTMGIPATGTFASWLGTLDTMVAGLTNAQLEAAWAFVRQTPTATWNVGAMGDFWANQVDFEATVAAWQSILTNFNFHPFLTPPPDPGAPTPPPPPPAPSTPGIFDFTAGGGLDVTEAFEDILLTTWVDVSITNILQLGADPVRRDALNDAFATHVYTALDTAANPMTGTNTISDWLETQLVTGVSAADLDLAWSYVRANTPFDDATIGSLWAGTTPNDQEIAFNMTVHLWRTAITGFDFVPFMPPATPTTPRPSTPADFDFSTITSADTFGGVFISTLLDGQMAGPTALNTLLIGDMNAAFITRMTTMLATSSTDSIASWLAGLTSYVTQSPVLVASQLETVWQFVLDGDPWDAATMGAYFQGQAGYEAVVALWESVITGFNFRPFMSLIAGFSAPMGISSPAALSTAFGTHDMVVDGLPQPRVPGATPGSPSTAGVFNLSPYINVMREPNSRPIVIEVPFRPPGPASAAADFLQTFRFEGLDFNWPYYVIVDSFVEFFEYVDDGSGYLVRQRVHETLISPPSRDYSDTTAIAGIITYTPLPDLDPGEIVPPTPQDLRVEPDYLGFTTAAISWLDMLPLVEGDAGRIEFEIVRFRDIQASPEAVLNNRSFTMSQFINALDPSGFEAGVRTNRVDPLDWQLVVPTGVTNSADPFSIETMPGNRLILHNEGLNPNTLYFYYVRTVWITDSGETFSAWVGVSLTTRLVSPPQNLRIVDHGSFPNENINPQNQMVIRFEAPVVAADYMSLFRFRFTHRDGLGQWSAPAMIGAGTNHRQLSMVPSSTDGYYTFTYLVTGLAPGRTYQFRVHTLDVVNTAGTGGYVYSEWSNIATGRTEVDQDYMDRERDRENLRRYLRDLLMEFLRRPYWIAMDQGGHFIAMYRPTMQDYLLQANGQVIRLADTGQQTTTLYLPQSLFLAIWDGGQGFVIQRNDMTITIPNQAINSIGTEPVIDVIRRMRDVRGVEDYYIRLVLDVRAHAATQIQGELVAGQQVILGIDLVESNTIIRQVDENLMNSLLYAIETDHFIDRIIGDRHFTFGQEISNMVEENIAYLYQVRRLREIAEVINHEMSAYVNTRLRATYGRAVAFNHISQPVSIALGGSANNDIVSGFQFGAGSWVRQSVEQQGTNRIVRTQTPGSFAFTRQSLAMPGLNTIQGHDRLGAIIANHGLAELFGAGNNFDINANVSLNTVQGVVARLAGAPAGMNSQNWLRNQGYIVPVRGANAPAQTQEVVYTLMALYEMGSGTTVSSLRITNFNALNGITGIDNRFRPYIQAAFQLNIYTNRNMQPTAPMSNGDFLRLLLVLDQRIGL